MTPRQQFGLLKGLPRCTEDCQCKYCYLLDVLEWDEICRMIEWGWLDPDHEKYILQRDEDGNFRAFVPDENGKYGVLLLYVLIAGGNYLNVQYDAYLNAWIDRVIEQNPKCVKDIEKGGKKQKKALNFLCGRVMMLSEKKADPDITKELIEKRFLGS